MKNRQTHLISSGFPLRIRSGHVTDQSARVSRISIQQQRKMARERLAILIRDQRGKAVMLDKVMQFSDVGFQKAWRNIHRNSTISTQYTDH